MSLRKAIELVNVFHDLGYNWEDRDGLIIHHLLLIAIFGEWSEVVLFNSGWF